MKILVISAAFPPMQAGEADQTSLLCQQLAAQGHKIEILTSTGTDAKLFSNLKIRSIMRDWSWREMWTLSRVIQKVSPDGILLIFSGWIYNYHPMITFVPVISKLLLSKAPFVTLFGVPEGADLRRTSIVSRLVRKAIVGLLRRRDIHYNFGALFSHSDRLIMLSERHISVFSQWLPGIDKKTLLVPPPPILPMSEKSAGTARLQGRSELGIGEDAFLVSYFGYIYPGKGIETLLEAFSLAAKNDELMRLVFIGGFTKAGPNMIGRLTYGEELKCLAINLGIHKKIMWTGYIEHGSDRASVYLHSADVCVLPFDDGVALNRSSMAVAAAHHLPIITTRSMLVEPQFKDGENVLLCPIKDAPAIAQSLLALRTDPELREKLRKGVSDLAREWFSWDVAVRRIVGALGLNVSPRVDEYHEERSEATRKTFLD